MHLAGHKNQVPWTHSVRRPNMNGYGQSQLYNEHKTATQCQGVSAIFRIMQFLQKIHLKFCRGHKTIDHIEDEDMNAERLEAFTNLKKLLSSYTIQDKSIQNAT